MESTTNSSLDPASIRSNSEAPESPHKRSQSTPDFTSQIKQRPAPLTLTKSSTNLSDKRISSQKKVARSSVASFTSETQQTSSGETISIEASVEEIRPIPLAEIPPQTEDELNDDHSEGFMQLDFDRNRSIPNISPPKKSHLETLESFAQIAYKDESSFLGLQSLETPIINVAPEKESKFNAAVLGKVLDATSGIRKQWSKYPSVPKLEEKAEKSFFTSLKNYFEEPISKDRYRWQDLMELPYGAIHASKKSFCQIALKEVQSNSGLLKDFVDRLEAVSRTIQDICDQKRKISTWCSETITYFHDFQLLYGREQRVPQLLQKFYIKFKESIKTDEKRKQILEHTFKEIGFQNLHNFLMHWSNPNTIYSKYQDRILPLFENIVAQKTMVTKTGIYRQRHTWHEPLGSEKPIRKIGSYEIGRIFMQGEKVLFESITINGETFDTITDCLSSPPNPSSTKPFLGIQIAFYKKLFAKIYTILHVPFTIDQIQNQVLIILLVHEFLQAFAQKVRPPERRSSEAIESSTPKKSPKKPSKNLKKAESARPAEEPKVIELNFLRKDLISQHIPSFHGVNLADLIDWESVKKAGSVRIEDIENTILNSIPIMNVLRLCTNSAWGKGQDLVIRNLYPFLFQESQVKTNIVQSKLAQGIGLEINVDDKDNYTVTQIKKFDVFKKLNDDPKSFDIDPTKKIATLTFRWSLSPAFSDTKTKTWKGVLHISKIDLVEDASKEFLTLQAHLMTNLNDYKIVDTDKISVTSEGWQTTSY